MTSRPVQTMQALKVLAVALVLALAAALLAAGPPSSAAVATEWQAGRPTLTDPSLPPLADLQGEERRHVSTAAARGGRLLDRDVFRTDVGKAVEQTKQAELRDETCSLNGVPCVKFKHPKWSKKHAKKLRKDRTPSTDHLRKALGKRSTKALKRLYGKWRKQRQRETGRCCLPDPGAWFAEAARKAKCAATSAASRSSYAQCAHAGSNPTVYRANQGIINLWEAAKSAADSKVARFVFRCGTQSLIGFFGVKKSTDSNPQVRRIGYVGVGWALAECSNGYLSNKFWPFG